METRLKLTSVKNSFSGVITSRYCLRSFAGSPIISPIYVNNPIT